MKRRSRDRAIVVTGVIVIMMLLVAYDSGMFGLDDDSGAHTLDPGEGDIPNHDEDPSIMTIVINYSQIGSGSGSNSYTHDLGKIVQLISLRGYYTIDHEGNEDTHLYTACNRIEDYGRFGYYEFDPQDGVWDPRYFNLDRTDLHVSGSMPLLVDRITLVARYNVYATVHPMITSFYCVVSYLDN